MQAILQSQQQIIKATPTAQAAAQAQSRENEIENLRLMDKQTKLLEKIEENTRGKGEGKEKKEDPKKGLGLDGLITAVAIAAGTVAGLISAWAKTVKFFVSGIGVGIEKTVVFLSKWFPSLRKILFNIEVGFVMLVEGMKGIFKSAVGSVRTVFGNMVGTVTRILEPAVNFFKGIFGEGSAVAKIVTSIRTAVSNFLNPIMEGFKVVTESSGTVGKFVSWVKGGLSSVMQWFSGIGKFFSGMGASLGQFSKIFSAVSGIVSKIAYPLMVVMAVWDTIKGAIAGWEEGGLVGAIGGAIKGLFNSLVGGVLDLIKGAISWIAGALGFTAVEEFLDSFSFGDIFGSFVDAVLFIPKKIQEFIVSPIETMKKIGAAVMELWDKIPQIMGQFFDAVMWLPNKLFALIDEYIVQPLSDVFKPVTDFFKKIKDQLFGFFEDFGIPEIGFTIPIIDKKVSIGPFYPFRPDEGTARVAANKSLKQSSGPGGETETYNDNVVSTEKGKTNVLQQGEVTKDGKTSFSQNMVSFDPKTGKVTMDGDALAKARGGDGVGEISKRAFGQVKSATMKGADSDAIADIIKEDDAYQKLGFFDRRKVDVGYAKASDLLAAKEAKEKPETKPTGKVTDYSQLSPEAKEYQRLSQQVTSLDQLQSGGKSTFVDQDEETKAKQDAMRKNLKDLGSKLSPNEKKFVDETFKPVEDTKKKQKDVKDLKSIYGDDDLKPQAITPTSADAVTTRSADNAALKDAPPAPASSTTVVSAPVNNNSTNVLNSRRPVYDTDAMGANNFWTAQSRSRLALAY